MQPRPFSYVYTKRDVRKTAVQDVPQDVSEISVWHGRGP